MVRNRLLWGQLSLMVLSGLAIALFAWCWLGAAAFGCCMVAVAVCMAVAWLFSWRRYREIRLLTLKLDEALHSQRTITFDECREGDVAVLANELEKLVARLLRTSELLAQEKQVLANALEDISHQIRTPLTSVGLMVPLVASAESACQRKQLLRDLERQVDRTSWLVTALLQLAKLDAGALELECRTVTVESLARRAAEPLLLSYDLNDVTLVKNIPASVQYLGDERWSAEALGNVLKNCLEHTPAGGRVEIFAQETTLATTIVVTDTGNGFCVKDLPHVFERFYRGSASLDNSTSEGFGIGLAFARALTEAQGGSLIASNAKQGGARFVFTFPKFVV